MDRVFSGIQPTGDMQLGNYLGAVRFWAEDQYRADSFFCVVDLHALTQEHDPAALRDATVRKAAELLACGLDPDVCTLFVQSHVAAHSELSWLMECTASFGELRRMTQFKDKSEGQEGVRAGLFTYPCLMAADILLYDTTRVPVGDDQRQHLELARDLAIRWNHRFGDTFTVPEPAIPKMGARVMDLQEPTAKMSKSRGTPQGRIDVFEDPASIARKIKRAVTDADGEVRYDPGTKPGVSNLLELLAVTTGSQPDEVAVRYTQYGPLKADTADAVVEFLRPVQERFKALEADPAHVRSVLAIGEAKATAVAAGVLARAHAAIGLLGRSGT
ncbi:MAG: tryptophan--tRNA ligase [Acidimicrobiales bacterium]